MIKTSHLIKGIVSTSMGITRVVGNLLQFAVNRDVYISAQSALEFLNRGNFIALQPCYKVLTVET